MLRPTETRLPLMVNLAVFGRGRETVQDLHFAGVAPSKIGEFKRPTETPTTIRV